MDLNRPLRRHVERTLQVLMVLAILVSQGCREKAPESPRSGASSSVANGPVSTGSSLGTSSSVGADLASSSPD